jgi:hypothetical protein
VAHHYAVLKATEGGIVEVEDSSLARKDWRNGRRQRRIGLGSRGLGPRTY